MGFNGFCGGDEEGLVLGLLPFFCHTKQLGLSPGAEQELVTSQGFFVSSVLPIQVSYG